MNDNTITCIQCDQSFPFSESERQRFDLQGFDPPKRCPSCRKNKIKNSDVRDFRRKEIDRENKKKYFSDDNEYD